MGFFISVKNDVIIGKVWRIGFGGKCSVQIAGTAALCVCYASSFKMAAELVNLRILRRLKNVNQSQIMLSNIILKIIIYT